MGSTALSKTSPILTADSAESQPASGAVVDPVNLPGGVIGNTVWLDENGDGKQDAGEDGIANLLITLYAADGTTVVATTKTDAEGNYIFTDLPADTYTVTVTTPSGMDVTYDEDQGWDGTGSPNASTTIILTEDEEHLTADFGLNWVPYTSTDSPTTGTTGAIGDFIWNDADGDGVQDAGESGIEGVTVNLYSDHDGDGVYDNLVGTAVTDATGHYIFDGVVADAYVVEVAASPAGFTAAPTGDPDGDFNNTSEPFVLAPGDVYLNGDFGYQSTINLADVSGTLYLDADANSNYGEGADNDQPTAGITVSLIDDAGNILATTTTDTNGDYTFADVPAGDYTVWVNDTDNVLSGKTQTEEWNAGAGGACVTCDSIASVTVAAVDITDVDFGYTPDGHTTGEGLIAGTVVIDSVDNNIVDPADEGLEGISSSKVTFSPDFASRGRMGPRNNP